MRTTIAATCLSPAAQILLLTISVALFLPASAPAQGTPSTDAVPGVAQSTPANPIEQVTGRLAAVQQELQQLASQPNAESAEWIRSQQKALEQIQNSLEQQLLLLNEQQSQAQATDIVAGLPDLSTTAAPYSVVLLDQVREIDRIRTLALGQKQEVLSTAEDELILLNRQLATRQQELRAEKERAHPEGQSPNQLATIQLDVRLLEQKVEVSKLQLQALRADIRQLEREGDAIRTASKEIRKQVEFSAADWQNIQVQLDAREARLRRQAEVLHLRIRQLEAGAAGEMQNLDEMRLLRRSSEAIEERLQRVPEDREAWSRRYTLYQDRPALAVQQAWKSDNQKQLARLERLLRVKQLRLEELQGEARARTIDTGESSTQSSVESQLADVVSTVIEALRRSITLEQNLESDLLRFSSGISLRAIGVRLLTGINRVWNYEITSIEDRSVTVRKVLIALIFLLIGIRLARWLSQKLVHKLLSRTKIDDSVSYAISTLLFYILAVIVFVAALGSAGIPLTLFTLLGGALAIGLGFGSQNIINNFISGLILLIERPIRVGDMVDVGGTQGKVIKLGLRCTQVRTFNNIDILVPNSQFLESNVINWTLTDNRARGELFIGVAYGSPIEQVRTLMLQAAREHPLVLKTTAPEVMFMDFGDNALTFRLYIWVHMRSPSDRDRVLSDLRFTLDRLFKEHGIVIAFPQRDVHLHATQAIPVRLVEENQS